MINNNLQRVLIKDLTNYKGETILIKGWINVRRDQGKMIFLDIRDRSGLVQGVILPNYTETIEIGKNIRAEYAVAITGKINERPEKNKKSDILNGDIEMEIMSIEILAKAETLPFEISGNEIEQDLTTQLNNRTLMLRHKRVQAIMKVQAVVIDSFREFMKENDFFEFQAPCIVPATAEGGSEVFKIDYFKHKAYLTQSPQLYKQIVMSAFERVFSVNKVFRAEPSSTTRHLTEIVSLDCEFGFINSLNDVIEMEEKCFKYILDSIKNKCETELKLLKVELPTMIDKTPILSLQEAQEKIFAKFGRDVRGEKDLNAEDERNISEIIKEETNSDFVFVYGYPTRHKPFYVYPNQTNPEINEGVDLICKGLEWSSGGRRINDYEQLLKSVKDRGMDENSLNSFLQAFKYGVPPEGGFAFGAERITMQILNLKNVREASMFPRDLNRIDTSLSSEGY